jgi:hypothetical protein
VAETIAAPRVNASSAYNLGSTGSLSTAVGESAATMKPDDLRALLRTDLLSFPITDSARMLGVLL